MRNLRTLLLLGPLLFSARALRAQASSPIISLGKAEVLPVEFSQIRGVRELRDGRVLVSDRLDLGVVVAQFGSATVTKVGRNGRGPQEYRLPTALSAIAGDSTLLTDEGNQRLAVIGPDHKVHRTFTLNLPNIGFPMGARGRDALGRFYLVIPGWLLSAGGRQIDSVPLVRFDPRTKLVDTVARLKGITPPPQRERRIPGFGHVPFAAQDVYALAFDGRLAIVRSGDFHIDWIAPDGRVTRGPPVTHETLPVTSADKLAFTRRFLETAPTSGKDANEGMSATPASALAESNVRRIAEANEFAETKPPFTSATPLISPEGMLWVERSVRLGEPATWETFDGSGRRVGRVVLPPNRQLAALGARYLYAIATDDDGVQHLERYPRPTR
jgi:hypothetical protein